MSGSKKLEIKKKIEDESRQKGEKIDQLTLPMSERKKKKKTFYFPKPWILFTKCGALERDN